MQAFIKHLLTFHILDLIVGLTVDLAMDLMVDLVAVDLRVDLASDSMAADSGLMAGRMEGNSSSDAYKERKMVGYTYIDKGRMALASQMVSQMVS
jgi:hypothetical protein